MSTPRPVAATIRDDARGELAEKVRALQAPASYSHRVSAVESIETHFAWVFLAGDYAYKLKKPAGNPLQDLRSLDARRRSCAEELRVNQPLARDVYLAVVPLVRDDRGQLCIGVEGTVVDWLVRMRRLPAATMLDRAIAAGPVSARALTSIGALLARFYRSQPRVMFEPDAYVERIVDQVRADRCALLAPELALDESHVQAALTAMWNAVLIAGEELGRRAREGRIVEAHGDLRPEHICVGDPPCVIDALESSRDLRTLDPAEELAFLWIECEFAGGVAAAEQILSTYRRESGDPVSERLLDFYRSRRAMVRAKIVAWHLLDSSVSGLAPWRQRAAAYLLIAQRYADRAATSG